METQDRSRIRRHISAHVRQARTEAATWIIFNVGEVCDELRLDSPHRYSVCCNVLDAEDFAHRERVDYHHRTGVWGTGDATYIFQLRPSSRRSESTFDGLSTTDWAKLLLVVGLACVVLRGGSNDKF